MERLPRLICAGPASFGQHAKEVKVHVLSESVFCPRAAILALESGEDSGMKNRCSDRAWTTCRLRRASVRRGIACGLGKMSPLADPGRPRDCWCIAGGGDSSRLCGRSRDVAGVLCRRQVVGSLHADRDLGAGTALFAAAVPVTIDLKPQESGEVNWWSLRKAGFDCRKPVESAPRPGQRLVGKPWRDAHKGHDPADSCDSETPGGADVGQQHVVAFGRVLPTDRSVRTGRCALSVC